MGVKTKTSFKPGEGGRPKGVQNKMTREFKDIMTSILFDEPEVTRQKLLDLRDSDDSSDRRTFWGMASKMLPQKIEGKLDIGLPTLILEQDYIRGQTREIPVTNGADPDE